MLKYYDEIKTQGQIYSVDMVRLTYDASSLSQGLSDYVRHLSEYGENINVKYFPNFSQFKYRHLWSFESGDGAAWSMGLSLGNDATIGFLEFNPNKCMDSRVFTEFFLEFKNKTVTRDISRWDLAIDVPIDRSRCILVKDMRKYQCILDKSKTEYLGCRSSGGYVKLYDKKAESNLDYDLTRLEITIKPKTDINRVFPTVMIMASQLNLDLEQKLGKTDSVLLQLLRSCDNMNYFLKQLTYRECKKLEPYLATDTVLGLDYKAYRQLISSLDNYT